MGLMAMEWKETGVGTIGDDISGVDGPVIKEL